MWLSCLLVHTICHPTSMEKAALKMCTIKCLKQNEGCSSSDTRELCCVQQQRCPGHMREFDEGVLSMTVSAII